MDDFNIVEHPEAELINAAVHKVSRILEERLREEMAAVQLRISARLEVVEKENAALREELREARNQQVSETASLRAEVGETRQQVTELKSETALLRDEQGAQITALETNITAALRIEAAALREELGAKSTALATEDTRIAVALGALGTEAAALREELARTGERAEARLGELEGRVVKTRDEVTLLLDQGALKWHMRPIPNGAWSKHALEEEANRYRNLLAKVHLGMAHTMLDGVQRDIALGQRLITEALNDSRWDATLSLVKRYWVDGDLKALEQLENSERDGSVPPHLRNLARIVIIHANSSVSPSQLGVPSVPQLDPAKFVRLAQEGSEEGDVPCTYELALCQFHGFVLPKDLAKAEPLFLAAAQQGLAGAQTMVGWFKNTAVPPSPALALQWFRKAADQGNSFALYNLALNLEKGNGAAANLQEAKQLYKLSAKQGYEAAKKALLLLGEPMPSA